MTRQHVAVVAVRVVAVCLMVNGIASGAALALVPAPDIPGSAEAMRWTVLTLGVLPVATGLLLWSLGDSLARRVFRDQAADDVPSTSDLHRVASVCAGLMLAGFAVPRVVMWISSWVLSYQTKSTLLGPIGLAAEQRAMLFSVQSRSAAIATGVQLALGLVLVLLPERVEDFLSSLRQQLRREPMPTDADG